MERLQRFSIRKLSIGAVSCVIGTVAFLSYSNEVKAAENTDTSLKIVETNSANNSATSNVNVDNTNKQAVVNTSDQSKSEDSSAVAPTSEKTQLQPSQDSSIKVKENNLNNDKSDTTKALAKPTNLNDENNSRDPDSKDIEVKPKESSNVDTNEQNEKKVTWHDTFHWVYADKDAPNNKALHKAEDDLAGKKFADDTVLTITFTPKDGKFSTDGIKISQTGTKLNIDSINDLGIKTDTLTNKAKHQFSIYFDFNDIPVPKDYELESSGFKQTFDLDENDGQIRYQTPDMEKAMAVYKRNSQTVTIKYVDDDENGRNVFDPITSTVKEGQIVNVNTNIQDNLKQLENYILVPNQNLPEQITVGNKAIDPIVVHLKHKTEQREATKEFVQSASFSLSGLLGAGLSKSPNSYDVYIAGQELFIKGTQKYDLVTERFLGEATWDYNHIYQGNGNDDDATEAKDLDAINSLGDLDKTYINEGSIYYADHPQYNEQYKEQHEEQYNELDKLISKAYDGVISTQTWLKDGLHADGYYLSEKTSLVFDGKSWLNLKEYQEKVDPNFTWTTTSSPEVMQGDHAVDHINPEKLTLDLLPKLDSELNSGATGIDSGREIFLNYVPYTYKHHSAQRTINIHLPNGEVKTVSQKADVKQPVFTVYTMPDARNNKLASQETGNWTGGEWAEYDAPVVAGYTASQPTVSAKTVTGDTQNETIDITYVASEHTSHVKLVDNDNKTIQDTPVMGKTGETANVSVTVPKGWQLVSGQELPTQISFNAEGHPDVVVQIEHKTIKVTPDNPKENGTVLPDNPSVHFNGVSHDDLNKTVTRTVNITDPSEKKTTSVQTVTFTRGATVDEVTGEVTYGNWSEGGKHTFDKVDVPSVAGYTASGDVPSVVVTPESESSTVKITYTANDGNQTIVYQDDNDGEVGKQVVPGKTDQTVKVTPEIPDGYVVTGEVPSEVTIKPKDTPIIVHVEHGKSHVTPDKPVNKGDLIPGTKDKHYPDGLAHDDLNKTITRKVTIIDPTGKKTITMQTVTFTRDATVDEVTGEVTYGNWSENGQHTFDKVEVPTISGYTENSDVPSIVVTPSSTSGLDKVITYVANEGSQTIIYVDENGKKVGQQVVTGKTGDKVKVTPEIPSGYESNDKLPKEVTIKAKDEPLIVKVIEKIPEVNPDQNVTDDDSNKNINQESTPEQSSEDTSKDTESHEVKTDNKKNHTISVQEKHSDHKKLGEKLTVTTKSESKLRTATSKHLEKMSNSTLPQTGKSKDFLSIMGLVATALSGVFGFGLKKKKKE